MVLGIKMVDINYLESITSMSVLNRLRDYDHAPNA